MGTYLDVFFKKTNKNERREKKNKSAMILILILFVLGMIGLSIRWISEARERRELREVVSAVKDYAKGEGFNLSEVEVVSKEHLDLTEMDGDLKLEMDAYLSGKNLLLSALELRGHELEMFKDKYPSWRESATTQLSDSTHIAFMNELLDILSLLVDGSEDEFKREANQEIEKIDQKLNGYTPVFGTVYTVVGRDKLNSELRYQAIRKDNEDSFEIKRNYILPYSF